MLSVGLAVVLVGILLGTKLMGLTGHHLSASEQLLGAHLTRNDLGLRTILKNPINLPFSLVVYSLEKLHLTDPLLLRGISALFGAIAIGAFYLVLKNWHSPRVAILGTALFATSAWSLHVTRLASPEVLLMAPMLLILCTTWLEVSPWRRTILVLYLVTSLLLIYVPAMIIFVIAGTAWQAKHIYAELRQLSLWFIACWIILGLLLLVPLFWMLSTAPHNALALLGIPSKLPTPKQYGLNLLNIPINLFARGPLDAARWLGRLPLLDIFSSIMVVLGLYAYAFRFRLDHTKLLAGIFLAGSLLVALGGNVTITLLMPFVYIVASGGITLMFQQWAAVFPRNPFAKTLATTLMSVIVLMAVFYNINHYFIAWPNAPETQQVFRQ